MCAISEESKELLLLEEGLYPVGRGLKIGAVKYYQVLHSFVGSLNEQLSQSLAKMCPTYVRCICLSSSGGLSSAV